LALIRGAKTFCFNIDCVKKGSRTAVFEYTILAISPEPIKAGIVGDAARVAGKINFS
jgi:hypothetical protein